MWQDIESVLLDVAPNVVDAAHYGEHVQHQVIRVTASRIDINHHHHHYHPQVHPYHATPFQAFIHL